MRITVGGVLLMLGAAGLGYYAAETKYLDPIKGKVNNLIHRAGSLTGFLKMGGRPEPTPDVYSPPPPFEVSSSTENANSVQVSSSAVNQAAELAASLLSTQTVSSANLNQMPGSSGAVVKKKAPTKGAIKKKSTRKKIVKKGASPKTRTAKSKTRSATKPATKTVVKSSVDKLIGTYVALELITGQSVKGILESKDSQNYVIDIPGMGPWPYPIENVRNIRPAD